MKVGACILILFSAFAFSLCAFNLFSVYTHPLKYELTILECSKKYDLPPELIASVINVESSFNETAKSKKGAIGLMQIKLSTANYMNELNNRNSSTESELYIPKINLNLGCEYLRYLMNKFQNLDTVLASYNAGETIVRSWLNSGIYSTDTITLNYIPYEETRNYVKKINENIKYYKKIFIN